MPKTRIKICGITCAEDALAAAEAGADAIGMVFYKPAPRCVTMGTALEILAVLPPFVTPVGLFVDAGIGEIRQTIEALGLRHVQLHGHESPEVAAGLRDRIVLKALRVTPDGLADELATWKRAMAGNHLPHLRGFVLETAGKAAGGAGVENDWDAIARVRSEGGFDGTAPIIAAGGLNPENVARVIQQLKPWAVDVSSGVEVTRGRKSVDRMWAFVDEVRKADVAVVLPS